jgi:hypothetical protein
VERYPGELSDRVFRILPAGVSQPDRLERIQHGPAQGDAEIVTMSVFAIFSVLYLGETLRWNYAAACACMVGAAFFMFRG